jgi:hypothetical protein
MERAISLPPETADSRLPPGVARLLAPGETAFLCAHPRALPPTGSAPADFVVLPLAFAWLYPDSLLLVEALEFARRGLILHGESHDASVLPRLRRLCLDLRLAPTFHDESGREFDVSFSLAADVTLFVRAIRSS